VNRRWYVSDAQRIVIYIAVVAAVFLAAMALGWQKFWLLLVAVSGLGVTIVGVLAAAARRGAGGYEVVTARVLSVSSPPPNTGIAARCDMVLEVLLPGRAPVRARHRDPAVPLERWPQPGQTFPVEVRSGSPRRHLHIRWDLVGQGMVRAPDAPSSGGNGDAAPAFVWEDENEPIVYSPTPPRPRRPSSSPSSPSPSAASASPVTPPSPAPPPASSSPPSAGTTTRDSEPEVFLYETFADLDDALADFDAETVRTPAPPAVVDQPRADPNGHDPDGYDPADFETPHLAEEAPEPAPAVRGGPGFEPITLSDFDPADVDIRDFMDEPPAVTTMPPDEEPAADAAATKTPAGPAATKTPSGPAASEAATPATAAEPTAREPERPSPTEGPSATAERGSTPGAAPAPAIPQPRDPSGTAAPGPGVTATRPVTDLSRSLRFYRDTLGFSVVFSSARSALVERGGTRVLLDERAIQPSPGEVHLDVTGIEEVCASVRAGLGEVIEAPAPVYDEPGLQLWRARLRDPDGHTVEVIEWRSSKTV
jgi:catechol 2,3-dioxygenase-like lactoylglutathione lyase family enzyme